MDLGFRRLNELSEEKIAELLGGKWDDVFYDELRGIDQQTGNLARCSAVLVPLIRVSDSWHLVFIRRTETVSDHKGQVAFPGGSCEPEDASLEDTALRETEEEIGVLSKDVRILGRLRGLVTVSKYQITPVVGTFDWPYRLTPSEEEVSRIFNIPLEWIIQPENQETRMLNRLGREVPVIYFKPFEGEILWGATARMVNNLLDALKLK